MNCEYLSTSTTNTEPARWIWPLLTLSLALMLIAGMIYAQHMMQQVETIEQNQVSQHVARSELLSQPDVLNINWMRTLNPLAKDVQGDVVWSNQQQEGMMRFANLASLPSGQQYHLWIYDLASPADEPVSIVTFSPDLTLRSELLIPFTSSREISEPYKFMVMLEHTEPSLPSEPLLLAQP